MFSFAWDGRVCPNNAFLGQKGRKIYVEAQNARETSQKAEFEGEKPSCGMKNEKGGDVAATCGVGSLFARESAKGGLKRRAACASEQIGAETERIGAETERIGTETERIGAQAERVGSNFWRITPPSSRRSRRILRKQRLARV